MSAPTRSAPRPGEDLRRLLSAEEALAASERRARIEADRLLEDARDRAAAIDAGSDAAAAAAAQAAEAGIRADSERRIAELARAARDRAARFDEAGAPVVERVAAAVLAALMQAGS